MSSRSRDERGENSRETKRDDRGEDRSRAQPSYDASIVRQDGNGKDRFYPFGTVYKHRDQKGHTIDSPLGRIILREPNDCIEEMKAGRAKRSGRRRDEREGGEHER